MREAFPDEMAEAIAGHGMIVRGSVVFEDGEDAPTGPSGRPARSIVLIGHGGGTIWRHFQAWLESRSRPPEDPLDTWSRQVVEAAAERVGARAVFPSDKPYLPFQQWAMRAEGLRPSPLGILMHPEFGLWHAYRGALLLDAEIEIQAPHTPVHLCDTCDGKPCMNCCPAGAVSPHRFDVSRCWSHVASEAGGQCRENGCMARAACPFDRHRYSAEQIAFHMAAYLRGIGQG